MAKPSKTVPQKVASSSSQPPVGPEAIGPEVVALDMASLVVVANEPAAEPPLKAFMQTGPR